MIQPDFALTPEEQKLLAEIKFKVSEFSGYKDAQRNGKTVNALVKSLLERKAIPAIRVKWFTDPELNPGGRGKSRKDIFDRNGSSGDEMLEHPSFLEFLFRFLCGPDLPKVAITTFRAAVVGYGKVTSGDIDGLRKTARSLTRQYQLNAHSAADDFYLLALECGVWHSYAESIRETVRSVR